MKTSSRIFVLECHKIKTTVNFIAQLEIALLQQPNEAGFLFRIKKA